MVKLMVYICAWFFFVSIYGLGAGQRYVVCVGEDACGILTWIQVTLTENNREKKSKRGQEVDELQ